MLNRWNTVSLYFLIMLIFLPEPSTSQVNEFPSDQEATKKTVALFRNLRALSGKQILFGHQDAMAYGVEWKDWHRNRSDVKDVCGSHPALFGWELGKLGLSERNLDSVNFKQMQDWIREVYKSGSVNTISWHMDNYVTKGTTWDTSGGNVVHTILPGGVNHELFKKDLDVFAEFLRGIGKKVPIIFRPFHEHSGNWFWWGQRYCSPAEYKALWQFTVDYLRKEKNIHHLLFAYSTDVVSSREEYLEKYPGDEYVDIIGIDDYRDVGQGGSSQKLVERLRMIVNIADEKNKIAALTETGFEGVKNPNWWTQQLLTPILQDQVASRIAWLMVWRNDSSTHHYGPYPGHACVPDFLAFAKHERIMMNDRLPSMYKFKQ